MRLNGKSATCIWNCQRREIILEYGSGEKRRKRQYLGHSSLGFQEEEKGLEKDIREAAKEAHRGPTQRNNPNGE